MRRFLHLLGIGQPARGGEIDYVSVGVVRLGECGTCGKRIADADLYEHMCTHLSPPEPVLDHAMEEGRTMSRNLSEFRIAIYANSARLTDVKYGRDLGSFHSYDAAEAYLYKLIDYRGAVPVNPPDATRSAG